MLSQIQVEVSLAHLAAIYGKTEEQYAKWLSDTIDSGDLHDTLKIGAQVKLDDWIEKNNLLSSRFVVSIRLSANRAKDVCLYCLCDMNFRGCVPKMVARTTPGLSGIIPKSMRDYPVFEVGMCDLEVGNG